MLQSQSYEALIRWIIALLAYTPYYSSIPFPTFSDTPPPFQCDESLIRWIIDAQVILTDAIGSPISHEVCMHV